MNRQFFLIITLMLLAQLGFAQRPKVQQLLVSCDDVALVSDGKKGDDPLDAVVYYGGTIDNLEIKWRAIDGYVITEHIRTQVEQAGPETTPLKHGETIATATIDTLWETLQRAPQLQQDSFLLVGERWPVYQQKGTVTLEQRKLNPDLLKKQWNARLLKEAGMSRQQIKQHKTRPDLAAEVQAFLNRIGTLPLPAEPLTSERNINQIKVALVTEADTTFLVADADRLYEQPWYQYRADGTVIAPRLIPGFETALAVALPKGFAGRDLLTEKGALLAYARHLIEQDEATLVGDGY